MKEKIDCVLKSTDTERILLRFYPRRSHVYGLKKKIPTFWEEVGDMIFTYSIFHQQKDKNNLWSSELVYEEVNDENSVLMSISRIMKLISNESNTKNHYYAFPPGNGTSWNFSFLTKESWLVSIFQTNKICNSGIKFGIEKEDMAGIALKIDEFLTYMLENAEAKK